LKSLAVYQAGWKGRKLFLLGLSLCFGLGGRCGAAGGALLLGGAGGKAKGGDSDEEGEGTNHGIRYIGNSE